jgi:hypothetical protein
MKLMPERPPRELCFSSLSAEVFSHAFQLNGLYQRLSILPERQIFYSRRTRQGKLLHCSADMARLSSLFKKTRGEGSSSDCPGPTTLQRSPLRSIIHSKKSFKTNKRELSNSSHEVDRMVTKAVLESITDVITPSSGLSASELKPDAHSSTTNSLWERAEKMLIDDKKKKKIWDTYLEILESELGSELAPGETADRQQQLCLLLDNKTKELDKKQWMVQFGDHSVGVGDLFTKTFKNVLIARNIINSAASSSPPAAIACAGATVVLSVSKFIVTERRSQGSQFITY